MGDDCYNWVHYGGIHNEGNGQESHGGRVIDLIDQEWVHENLDEIPERTVPISQNLSTQEGIFLEQLNGISCATLQDDKNQTSCAHGTQSLKNTKTNAFMKHPSVGIGKSPEEESLFKLLSTESLKNFPSFYQNSRMDIYDIYENDTESDSLHTMLPSHLSEESNSSHSSRISQGNLHSFPTPENLWSELALYPFH
eukprot:Sdes_comp10547_c0_seq1m2239